LLQIKNNLPFIAFCFSLLLDWYSKKELIICEIVSFAIRIWEGRVVGGWL
jgi:hypothetical protein